MPKDFGFSVLVFIAVCGFFVFWHLVFGFRRNYYRFFGFVIRYGFWVFLFCPIWVLVSLRFERQLISNSHETPKLLRGMRDKLIVTVGDHACRMTPETLTSQTMTTVCELWSAMASNVPPTPATEEAIVDCVAFFLRGGKRRREFSKEKEV